MKKVYIILTHTGTIVSRIIKCYTGHEFSHVSISLDEELTKMYSFGRLNPYNTFIGGFVNEKIDSGTFKRFKKTKAAVYSLVVTDEQYEKMEQAVLKVQEEKDKYTFNILGLVYAAFNKKRDKEYCFYCAEFVKYVLEYGEIDLGLPKVIKPEYFKDLPELKLIYKGYLRIYPYRNIKLEDYIITRKSIRV